MVENSHSQYLFGCSLLANRLTGLRRGCAKLDCIKRLVMRPSLLPSAVLEPTDWRHLLWSIGDCTGTRTGQRQAGTKANGNRSMWQICKRRITNPFPRQASESIDMTKQEITLSGMHDARERITPLVRRTPVVVSSALSNWSGTDCRAQTREPAGNRFLQGSRRRE